MATRRQPIVGSNPPNAKQSGAHREGADEGEQKENDDVKNHREPVAARCVAPRRGRRKARPTEPARLAGGEIESGAPGAEQGEPEQRGAEQVNRIEAHVVCCRLPKKVWFTTSNATANQRGHPKIPAMKSLKFVGLFFAGVLVGAIAANERHKQVFWEWTLPKQVDSASMAMLEAEWLAGLRLNEADKVAEEMEKWMDGTVSAIAAWESVKPADEKSRKMRDRFLLPVKLYHESYPASGEGADRVKSFLASVPGREPSKECGSAICRLEAQRRSGPGVKAGPATK